MRTPSVSKYLCPALINVTFGARWPGGVSPSTVSSRGASLPTCQLLAVVADSIDPIQEILSWTMNCAGQRSSGSILPPTRKEKSMPLRSMMLPLFVLLVARPVFAQGWVEYTARTDRFEVPAPGQPKLET